MPSSPGGVKSVWELRKDAELIESSPLAALNASPSAVIVPPRQTDSVLIDGAPVISRTTRTASSGPLNKTEHRVFSRPTDAERDRRRVDLLRRAHLVRAQGWDEYRAVRSTGEVVGVAALLRDYDILGEFDETLQSAWAR